MILYILTALGIVLLIWAGLIYLRKALWDSVHRNLLDLEDKYGGKVIRNGFASRPVYKGVVHQADVTINFSTERGRRGRETYLDIAIDRSSPVSITIAESDWLRSQETDNPPSDTVVLAGKTRYHIMPAHNRKLERIITRDDFNAALARFNDLAYFFVGKTGTICEFRVTNLQKETEIDTLDARLQNIFIMLQTLR
ncbi:MAG: hypothetical protein D6677_06990 [Calditrichaeota bacterium]|nr:MAG: hypothetical protein D6677_06990 [Calditrichota bacterium]